MMQPSGLSKSKIGEKFRFSSSLFLTRVQTPSALERLRQLILVVSFNPPLWTLLERRISAHSAGLCIIFYYTIFYRSIPRFLGMAVQRLFNWFQLTFPVEIEVLVGLGEVCLAEFICDCQQKNCREFQYWTTFGDRQTAQRKIQVLQTLAQAIFELLDGLSDKSLDKVRTPLFTPFALAELLEHRLCRWTGVRHLNYICRIQVIISSIVQMLNPVLVIGAVEMGKLYLNPILLSLSLSDLEFTDPEIFDPKLIVRCRSDWAGSFYYTLNVLNAIRNFAHRYIPDRVPNLKIVLKVYLFG